jgi:hypothetical protein
MVKINGTANINAIRAAAEKGILHLNQFLSQPWHDMQYCEIYSGYGF